MLQLDLSAFERRARDLRGTIDQVPFALAGALNDALFKARDHLVNQTWPGSITVRNPSFIRAALNVERATKSNLSGAVFDRFNRGNLRLHDRGGFTAFNDRYHAGTRSRHASGMAGDFTLKDPRQSSAIAERLRDHYRGAGLKEGTDFRVLDEYLNRSARATGGHIHYELRNREAAEAYRAYSVREGAKRAKEMAERGGAFNQTIKGLRDQQASPGFELPKLGNGDDMLRKALKSPLMGSSAVDLKGSASLDISFKNAPAGMSTSTSMDGLFKELNLRKGASLPRAGVDI